VNLLLDTHALLWWLADSELTASAFEAIADPGNVVLVSAISVWEIGIKRSLGTLAAPEGIIDAISDSGFEPLPIAFSHARAAGDLPKHHRDPFDRMLIAQAMTDGLQVVTRDSAFEDYDVEIFAC